MVSKYATHIGYKEYSTYFGYEEDYVLPNPPSNFPPNAPPNLSIHATPNTKIHNYLNTLCYLWNNAPTNTGEGYSSRVMANPSPLV